MFNKNGRTTARVTCGRVLFVAKKKSATGFYRIGRNCAYARYSTSTSASTLTSTRQAARCVRGRLLSSSRYEVWPTVVYVALFLAKRSLRFAPCDRRFVVDLGAVDDHRFFADSIRIHQRFFGASDLLPYRVFNGFVQQVYPTEFPNGLIQRIERNDRSADIESAHQYGVCD